MAPAHVPKIAPPFAACSSETFVQAFFDEEFPLRGAFAARQNNRVHAFEIARRAHKYVIDAHARERRRVRFKITLNGEYSDFYCFFH